MGRELKCALFVCYDDISSNIIEGYNPVLYNPALEESQKRCLLEKTVKDSFGVSLINEQLDSLCKKDRYSLEEFVKELKSYI